MKNKIKKIIIVIFILFAKRNLAAQIIVDALPSNFYFDKTTLVQLNELTNNRSGIFYSYLNNNYLNYHNKKYCELTYETLADNFAFYKFDKNKYRYNTYNLKITSESINISSNSKEIIDSVRIEIWAKENLRKFNFKKFKQVLIFLKNKLIYTGYITIKKTFVPSNFPLVKELKLSKSTISLEQGNYHFEKDLDKKTLNDAPFLFFNFNEKILLTNNFSILQHLDSFYLGEDEDSFFIYFPLDYRK